MNFPDEKVMDEICSKYNIDRAELKTYVEGNEYCYYYDEKDVAGRTTRHAEWEADGTLIYSDLD